jgi:hypothetical protein
LIYHITDQIFVIGQEGDHIFKQPVCILTHFSDTGDEGDGDDGKPRSEKDKKEGEEKKSKPEINLGRLFPGKVINCI